MPTAFVLLRDDPHYRRDAFHAGLRRHGYRIDGKPHAGFNHEDVLVIWNRYGTSANWADQFERRGAKVICAENGYLGRDWNGGIYYALGRGWHNRIDRAPEHDDTVRISALLPERWGDEKPLTKRVMLLPQRGIGLPPVAMPGTWPNTAARIVKKAGHESELRKHPGKDPDTEGLMDAAARVGQAAVWASGAGHKLILAGYPVWYSCPHWIGGEAAWFLGHYPDPPYERDRMAWAKTISWAVWEVHEIYSGEAIDAVLHRHG